MGRSSIQTLTVTVTAVPPTATVSNSGPANEASPVTFTVSNLVDADPQATFSYAAQWSAGAGFVALSADEVTNNGNGASFQHVYDTASGPGGNAVTIEVTDSDGATADFTQNVVVNAVAPTATFGPSGGATTVAAGLPILFSNVSDPSNTEMQAGFTYHVSVNGGAYSSSTSPAFLLPDYTPQQHDSLQGYVVNAEGVSSPVYSAFVSTGTAQTVVANQGNGSVLVNGTTTLAPGQYLLTNGIDAGPHVTLLSSGASYILYTNGNFGTVDAAAGVASVQLIVHTDVLDSVFLQGMSPVPGSLMPMGAVAFDGNGDVGQINLPAGNASTGASTLSVGARGDLGGIAGPSGSSSKLWAQASSLVFSNLNGSITGLDSIMGLQAHGSLGRTAADQVWANAGIQMLNAFAIPATVTTDRNCDLSDLATLLNVGQGGIAGSVNVGNLVSATVGAIVNQVKARFLEGNFVQVGSGNVNLLTVLATAVQGAAPDIDAQGDANLVLGAKGQVAHFGNIKVPGSLKLKASGGLTVDALLRVGSLDDVAVTGDLNAKYIEAETIPVVGSGAIQKLVVGGNLTASGFIIAQGVIGTVQVGGTLTTPNLLAYRGITSLTVQGDLIASIVALRGQGSDCEGQLPGAGQHPQSRRREAQRRSLPAAHRRCPEQPRHAEGRGRPGQLRR